MDNAWQYCVVGNITKTHLDKEGILRYGTAAFTGGRKVYLMGKYWDSSQHTIAALGINRHGRHQVVSTDPKQIENVRLRRVYKPPILKIMGDFEFRDCWWGNTPEDYRSAKAFVTRWNAVAENTP